MCGRALSLLSALATSTVACFGSYRGDTEGFQRRAEWWTGARIVVEDDSLLTLRRLRAGPGDHDVMIAAFDFNPSQDVLGDEYSLSIAIDIGPPGAVPIERPRPLGPPDGLEVAAGSRIGLGPILRPDSVRGEFKLISQGMMHTIGRIDAWLYFSHWDDSTKTVVERLRRRVDFLRPPGRSPAP
jgi:hypothetical protein